MQSIAFMDVTVLGEAAKRAPAISNHKIGGPWKLTGLLRAAAVIHAPERRLAVPAGSRLLPPQGHGLRLRFADSVPSSAKMG